MPQNLINKHLPRKITLFLNISPALYIHTPIPWIRLTMKRGVAVYRLHSQFSIHLFSIYGGSPLTNYSIGATSLSCVTTACCCCYDNVGRKGLQLIILLPMNGMESRDSSRLLDQEVWHCSPRRRMCISRRASLGSQHATTSAVESAPSSATAKM